MNKTMTQLKADIERLLDFDRGLQAKNDALIAKGVIAPKRNSDSPHYKLTVERNEMREALFDRMVAAYLAGDLDLDRQLDTTIVPDFDAALRVKGVNMTRLSENQRVEQAERRLARAALYRAAMVATGAE